MFFFCLLFPDKVYSNLYELNDRSSLMFYNEKKDSVKIVNRSDRWLAIDKLQHFSYSCLISLGCQYVLVNKFNNGEKNALPLSSSLSFSAGLLKELNDRSSLIFSNEKGDSIKKVNRPDKWLAIDKLQHFSYSCLISLGCQYVLVNKFNNGEKDALPLSSSLSFSAGLLKELNDNRGKNGYFSIKDMVANLAGITVAAIIIIDNR